MGNEGTASSNYNNTGVLPSTISRGAGLTAQIGTDRFNSITFTAGSTVDLTDYLQFTISASSSTIIITDIMVQSKRSSQGPTSFVIRTSQDGYVTNATNIVSIGSTSVITNTFTFNTPVTTTTSVTIRLYGYNGGSSQTGDFGPGAGAGNDIIVNGTQGALPVKFVNFNAFKKNKNIEIFFTNLTESDVVKYVIERSVNGNFYNSIGQLIPMRNDGGKADYTFTDTQPLPGVNFYRIKLLERGGNVLYSTVIRINANISEAGISLFPNPVHNNQITLHIAHLSPGSYSIIILNLMGQTIVRQVIKHNGGAFEKTLQLAHLNIGKYYLQFNGADNFVTQFTVQ